MHSRRPTGVCDQKLLEQTRGIQNFLMNHDGWYAAVRDCEPIYAEKGYVEFTLTASKRLMNPGNTMHGGCIASIIDEVTASAIHTVRMQPMTSISINTSCIRAIPLGAELLLRGWVDKLGKNVAFAKMEFVLRDSGKVAATGEHHMFCLPGEFVLPRGYQYTERKPGSKL